MVRRCDWDNTVNHCAFAWRFFKATEIVPPPNQSNEASLQAAESADAAQIGDQGFQNKELLYNNSNLLFLKARDSRPPPPLLVHARHVF